MSVCKNCIHFNINVVSPEVREKLNFCLGFQGFDGCYAWGTPVWASMEDSVLHAVLDGYTSAPEKAEDCSAYYPLTGTGYSSREEWERDGSPTAPPEDRHCTCGSGEPVMQCGANSQYCG